MTQGYRELVAELRERRETIARGGPDAARERHVARGKMLARDRIDALLDVGSPFLEVAPLAAYGMYGGDCPAGGVVAGIGLVHGRHVMVVANDATVKGGSYFPITVKKHLRAQEIAAENRLPCVSLVDSGGAFLPMQDEVFPDRDHFGRIFYNQARMSRDGIPQIAAVLGSSTAGGAYVPAMSDETVIVRNQGTIFLGGPPLVKAATGEEVTAEELGGGDTHTRISGVADHLATDDADALRIAREIFAAMPRVTPTPPACATPEPPAYDPAEIYGIVARDPRKQTDVRELIADVLAENGYEIDAATDGAAALQLCDERHYDLILSDLRMPKMDGFEFMDELRGRSEWREIPVVVITAKDLTEEDRDRLNGGVERIIQKSNRDEMLRQLSREVSKCVKRRVA